MQAKRSVTSGRIAELKGEARGLEEQGAGRQADSQAAVLANIFGLQTAQVERALMLFLAVLVEAGAALGLYFATGHLRLERQSDAGRGRGPVVEGGSLKAVSQKGVPAVQIKQIAAAPRRVPRLNQVLGVGVRDERAKQGKEKSMSYVVPFMNNKGGTGKSVLARAYAVEAAKAGASVVLADLDDVQQTSKRWADHRRANGLTPDIQVQVVTPRVAFDLRDRSDVLVIDTPGWTDRESIKLAHWSTFCVIPSRANRMDDLSETVRLLHALRAEGLEDWRFGVALNAVRAATAEEDDRDARAYLGAVGFKALPGCVRDEKEYEIALLRGKAITETGDEKLNEQAFTVVNGIAGAVLEAGREISRQVEARRRQSELEHGKGGRSR